MLPACPRGLRCLRKFTYVRLVNLWCTFYHVQNKAALLRCSTPKGWKPNQNILAQNGDHTNPSSSPLEVKGLWPRLVPERGLWRGQRLTIRGYAKEWAIEGVWTGRKRLRYAECCSWWGVVLNGRVVLCQWFWRTLSGASVWVCEHPGTNTQHGFRVAQKIKSIKTNKQKKHLPQGH